MKTIYFMRHGQTDWNIQKRLQGSADIPLNETGVRQAREAGERFSAAGLRFDTVISSPLERSIKTAMLSARVPREAVMLDPRLTELDYGEYEGAYFDRLEGDILAFIRDPEHVPPPETVETIPALLKRAGDFLADVQRLPGESILVVTHGVAVRAILGNLTGGEAAMVWGMPVHNCQLVRTTLTDGIFTPAEFYNK